MQTVVVDIVSSVTKLPVNQILDDFEREGLWDSFGFVEIILAIEEEFDIIINTDEMSKIKNVNELVRIIKEKL